MCFLLDLFLHPSRVGLYKCPEPDTVRGERTGTVVLHGVVPEECDDVPGKDPFDQACRIGLP